jgi:hypothetical protein
MMSLEGVARAILNEPSHSLPSRAVKFSKKAPLSIRRGAGGEVYYQTSEPKEKHHFHCIFYKRQRGLVERFAIIDKI